jgi:hypothetical protein
MPSCWCWGSGSNGRENNGLPGHSLDGVASDAGPDVVSDLHIRPFFGEYYGHPPRKERRPRPGLPAPTHRSTVLVACLPQFVPLSELFRSPSNPSIVPAIGQPHQVDSAPDFVPLSLLSSSCAMMAIAAARIPSFRCSEVVARMTPLIIQQRWG